MPTREVQARSSHTRKEAVRRLPPHHGFSTVTNSPPDTSAEIKGERSSRKVSSEFISTVREEPFHNGDDSKHMSSSTSRGPKQCQTDLNRKPLPLQRKADPVMGISTDSELVSSPVKEDSLSYEGQTRPTADNSTLTDHKPLIRTHIKEEPSPHEEMDTSIYDISTQEHQKPETFHVQEESCSEDSPQSDRSSPVLCIQVPEIKEESEEEESPDDWTSAATDYPSCLSIDIKQEEEDEHFPDANIHSFTITGEYIEGLETKLKSKAMQDKSASTSVPSPITTYACPVCKRSFSNHGNLVRHRETHKGKKMLCSECGAVFCNKTDLTVHARTHKVNRTLYCSECNKTFQSNSHLIIHERIHTGEKPFSCSHCPKRFSSKSNLAEHMKVHTGAKQFCCSVCDKSYARKENLFSHQRIHKEAIILTCSHCGQGFVDEYKFTRHQRFHNMEKPHPCVLCGKRFTHKALLLRHERTHLSRSLICSDCGIVYDLYTIVRGFL
ncbi:zinc finger protein 771-like isoform X2 [Hyperolius riggenbachi]|uniref:zinc finger protein 771-like isoform X2 n=1 Tax=Hyperolius riggenbachi TaxID=752182 RepID=UPI0035A2B262